MRNFPHVWNLCEEKSTDTTDTKTTLWVNLSEFGFSSIMIVCGVQVTLKLNFNAM